MKQTSQNALDKAVEYLGAVEVAPVAPCTHLVPCLTPSDCAFTKRFAYFYAPNKVWHIAGRASLRSLAGVSSENPGTIWEAVSAAVMPTWWTPEKQLCCTGCQKATSFPGHYKNGVTHKLVAVNLETGEEVPA